MFLQVRNLVLLVCVGSALSAVLPLGLQDGGESYMSGPVLLTAPRVKRTAGPARAIMYSTYFTSPRGYNYNPPFHARNYEPQGAMSAFATGNSVATRSYYGNEYQPTNIQPANLQPNCGTCLPNGQEIPQGQPDSTGVTPPPADVATQPEPPVTILIDPQVPEVPSDVPEERPEEVPVQESEDAGDIPEGPQVQATPDSDGASKPHNGNGRGTKVAKTPKSPPKKPEEDEEEEYDEEDETPFLPGKGRGAGKHYVSYFPIYFGLPGYGSRGQGEGGPLNPGVATAIANSYSNGKGAVATSHATAYGGPNFGNGSKKGNKARAPQ